MLTHYKCFLVINKLREKIKKLNEIVEKLPKTIDGVYIVPGTNKNKVWQIAEHSRNGIKAGEPEESVNWDGWYPKFFSDMDWKCEYWPSRDISKCYSSKEALLAACGLVS
jgi:hypothetical protein